MGRFIFFCAIFSLLTLCSCESKVKTEVENLEKLPIEGTWKLLSGTIIEKNDTVVTPYGQDRSFIKIINKSHFAFLSHDLLQGKSENPIYSSGGGTYQLDGTNYTENLEYCTAREWENNTFHFTVSISGDTLIQTGVEKIEKSGIDRLNTEVYTRLSK